MKERSAQEMIEQSMQEAEQGRQRFLRRLDHEMKNPLTGLRAALVNRIILLHGGGQVDVRSRQDDPRGIVFAVHLPEAEN